MVKDRCREFEKKAVILNCISFVACIVMALTAPMPAFFIIALVFAIIEIIHFVFGDITTSYKLVAGPFFKWFGIVIIVIFLYFIIIAPVSLPEFTIFFIALFIAWLTEQGANYMRLKKKNNKIRGIIGLFKYTLHENIILLI